MTAKDRKDYVPPRRRFRAAVDGPMIRKWYAYMPTAELARRTGLTVKQIENYVYRHNTETWARKKPSVRSWINSENAKKRWAREKNTGLKCKHFLCAGKSPDLCGRNNQKAVFKPSTTMEKIPPPP